MLDVLLLMILLLRRIVLVGVVVANRSGFKGQTGGLVFSPNPCVIRSDLLIQGQVTVRGMGNSRRLTWGCRRRDLRRGMAVPLGDPVVQVKMILGRLSHRLRLLGGLGLVAQCRIEASLVGHILHRANLLPRIDVREGAADNSRAIRHFAVRPIDVAIETSGGVGELIWMRGWWRSRGRQQMRHISHCEGHTERQLERVGK